VRKNGFAQGQKGTDQPATDTAPNQLVRAGRYRTLRREEKEILVWWWCDVWPLVRSDRYRRYARRSKKNLGFDVGRLLRSLCLCSSVRLCLSVLAGVRVWGPCVCRPSWRAGSPPLEKKKNQTHHLLCCRTCATRNCHDKNKHTMGTLENRERENITYPCDTGGRRLRSWLAHCCYGGFACASRRTHPWRRPSRRLPWDKLARGLIRRPPVGNDALSPHLTRHPRRPPSETRVQAGCTQGCRRHPGAMAVASSRALHRSDNSQTPRCRSS
jgi:hypothetical protein